jgi:hypothetical protein
MVDSRGLLPVLLLSLPYIDGFHMIPKSTRSTSSPSRQDMITSSSKEVSSLVGGETILNALLGSTTESPTWSPRSHDAAVLPAYVSCEVYNTKKSCEEIGYVYRKGGCMGPLTV